MSTVKVVGISLLLFTTTARAAQEPPDLAFLEWLGQMTEVEELGMDIEQLLLSKEQGSKDEESQEKSQ